MTKHDNEETRKKREPFCLYFTNCTFKVHEDFLFYHYSIYQLIWELSPLFFLYVIPSFIMSSSNWKMIQQLFFRKGTACSHQMVSEYHTSVILHMIYFFTVHIRLLSCVSGRKNKVWESLHLENCGGRLVNLDPDQGLLPVRKLTSTIVNSCQ